MSEFQKAREAALKTCGPEIREEGYSLDTKGIFDSAKRSLEAKAGMLDKVTGGSDKKFSKVTEALSRWGEQACSDVARALGGAWKGDITLDAPAVRTTETAKAVPKAQPERRHALTDYATGVTSRTEKAIRDAGA